ncbi:lipoprotein [Pseudooceanicola nitratireducens]|uniref:lipoprotein n=1 Tax=Pseudooceanicola nitratireducens TaxID=517719 RepID=UPI001C98B42C|nr:lipoprotein [Pseudooceanicola nitratireducens]MBY6166459.1 lipoprotein [Pseudooceanicola nitratireducens]
MMMKPILILSLVAVTALTACGRKGNNNMFGNRQSFDGQYFRVKLDKDRANRAAFVVTVNDAGRSVLGAREAARHRANTYCIRQYGRSDLTWDVSPDVEDADLPIVNGALVLSGECQGWR